MGGGDNLAEAEVAGIAAAGSGGSNMEWWGGAFGGGDGAVFVGCVNTEKMQRSPLLACDVRKNIKNKPKNQ